jgi:hypothetical protein
LFYLCRDALLTLSFEASTFSASLGPASLYRVLVSAAVAASYREDAGGGARRLALHEGGRAALFQELSKLLYLLRSHSSFPLLSPPPPPPSSSLSPEQRAAAADDFELQVTAMHVLLCPHLCPSPPPASGPGQVVVVMNAHVFACRVAALQLLMLAASPDPWRFQAALSALAVQRGACPGQGGAATPLTTRVTYTNTLTTAAAAGGEAGAAGGGGECSARVPVLLVPLLRSLLGVLELQLRELGGALRGGLEGLVSSSSGAKLLPVLVSMPCCIHTSVPSLTHSLTHSLTPHPPCHH